MEQIKITTSAGPIKSLWVLLFVLSVSFPASTLLAQVKANPNGHFMEVNGANIYYEEYGQGEPLILLHGFGRTLEDWRPFISEYARTYRVIAWDMRGHGRSSNPDTGVAFLHKVAAKDLLLLMEKLKLGKVSAIGHSSGGILLLYAATIEPGRFVNIIPVSAQTFFGPEVRSFISQNAKPEDYMKFNEMEAQHGKEKGMILARQFYHFHELKGDPDIRDEDLKKISAHTLVVHGDNDFVPVSQAWEMFRHISSAHLWVVPNGWHMPHLGKSNTPDFIRQTTAFLHGDWNPRQE
ncbi:alpha/beta fold hydrolase [Flavihumibacter petaseus]|uniref:Putative hydrolase n=1 Tax=Flavihumibacter petaseus NBRC 106054 TaxID=1220578 RepID=A0A0E9N0F7_9BACT|nr:alpha/beta hydrolase [Flavihumibacter petaseus]GAO43334.1 putative hydrolase [Flavihumibacter petaseus NBRC 106054]